MKFISIRHAAAAAILALSLAASPVRASELSARFEHAAVQVSLPGSYLKFSVYRSSGPSGPWTPLLRDNTDCLAGCGYQDLLVSPGDLYYYRLDALGADRHAGTYGPLAIRVPSDRMRATPSQNPSRGPLRFDLHVPPSPLGSRAFQFSVFGPDGRMIYRADAGSLWPGERSFQWDGRDDSGRPLGSGVYFYRFRGEGAGATGRILRVN